MYQNYAKVYQNVSKKYKKMASAPPCISHCLRSVSVGRVQKKQFWVFCARLITQDSAVAGVGRRHWIYIL